MNILDTYKAKRKLFFDKFYALRNIIKVNLEFLFCNFYSYIKVKEKYYHVFIFQI